MSNHIISSSLKESESNEAMFQAVINNDIKSVINNDIKSVKSLNINIVDDQGKSLLHIAAEHGHLELFKYFISQGLNIKYKDNNKNNALYYACIGGNEEIINSILDIEPTIGRKTNNSLLQILYTNRSMETIYKLISSGININGTDILNSACKNNDFEFVKYLVFNGADIQLINQTNLQNVQIIDYVYRRGYHMNIVDMFSFALSKRNNQIIHYMVYDDTSKPNIDKIADLCRGSSILDDSDKMSYLVRILGSYNTNLLFSKIDVSKDIRDKINMQNTKTECKKSNYISELPIKTSNLNVFEQLARNAWQRGEPHWA
jgi:ankyrin repeat protein